MGYIAISGKNLDAYIKREEQKIIGKIHYIPLERDFVSYVRKYISDDGYNENAIAISGLRGMGKTYGILQAVRDNTDDTLYLCADKEGTETFSDYENIIKQSNKKNIIIDEFSWIKYRETDTEKKIAERNKFISVLESLIKFNGRHIIITGTESFTIESLNVMGDFIHRVDKYHINLFTYDEYCRLYRKTPSKETMKDYLYEGGVFDPYVREQTEGIAGYMQTAVIDTLTEYIKNRYHFNESEIKSAVYNIIYKAVCPSSLTLPEVAKTYGMPLENFLSRFGIRETVSYNDEVFKKIGELLGSIGFIIRVDNYDENSTEKYRYYITNPALTTHFTKIVYNLDSLDNDYLGHVYEAIAVSYMYYNKNSNDKLFYYKNDARDDNELDFIIKADNDIWLFECKWMSEPNIPRAASLMSDRMEELFHPSGRYIVYNGIDCVGEQYGRLVACTGLGKVLNQYRNFTSFIETHPVCEYDGRKIENSEKFSYERKQMLANCTKAITSSFLIEKLDATDQIKSNGFGCVLITTETLKILYDLNKENIRILPSDKDTVLTNENQTILEYYTKEIENVLMSYGCKTKLKTITKNPSKSSKQITDD